MMEDIHTYGVNSQQRHIYLHSYHTDNGTGEEPGVDFRMATTFIKNIHLLDQPPFEPILIHMQSIGGCWQNGMAVFNMIEFCRSPIKMLAYAQASSMTGIILQAAPLRIMMPDCHLMIHHGTIGGSALHPFAIKNETEYQFSGCRRMMEIFAKRAVVGEFFKKKKSSTAATAYKFFDKKLKEKVDWYLTSGEALFYGLCDGILGSEQYPDIHSLHPIKSQTDAASLGA